MGIEKHGGWSDRFFRALRRLTVAKVLVSLLLIGGAVLMIAPFLWVLSSSMRPFNEAISLPPKWLPPLPPTFYYYKRLVSPDSPFVGFFLNSVKVSLIVTIGVVINSALAGYAFARLKFPGRNLIFGAMLLALMIPIQTLIVPLFLLMRFLGLVDTHWSLILPGLLGAFVPGMPGAFGVFMLRQFFKTVPRELEDAAMMDGAGQMRTFTQIMAPLASATLFALFVIMFSFAWNDYFLPLIFLQSVSKMVMPVGILAIRQPFGTGDPVELAAVTLSTFPLMIVFILGQRRIIENFVATGLKG